MRSGLKLLSVALFLTLLGGLAASSAQAHPSFFASRCASCHSNDTATCNGCHHHRGTLTATPNKTEYQPGEVVVVTLNGGTQSGWIRGLLYDASNQEIDRRSGPTGMGDDGQGSPVTFPVTLTSTAPTTPGTYTWNAAWFGNPNDSGSQHGETRRSFSVVVAQPTAGVEDPPPPVRQGSWGRVKALYEH